MMFVSNNNIIDKAYHVVQEKIPAACGEGAGIYCKEKRRLSLLLENKGTHAKRINTVLSLQPC